MVGQEVRLDVIDGTEIRPREREKCLISSEEEEEQEEGARQVMEMLRRDGRSQQESRREQEGRGWCEAGVWRYGKLRRKDATETVIEKGSGENKKRHTEVQGSSTNIYYTFVHCYPIFCNLNNDL